uniref:acylneuraminate cytidylyltransferase family protein n=1 Tax=Roseobacter litoralis TaxID=42443 RepID=UPI002494D58A
MPNPGPIAILPARGGSKRIPRKNIADLCGRPLLSYPIKICLGSGLFSDVIVSTDDDEIAQVARDFGATADMRPDALAGDTIPAKQVCAELLRRRFDPDSLPEAFCLVYPMAAFILPEDLIESVAMLVGQDVVLGVSHYPMHPYKALIEKDGHLQALWPEQNQQQSQTYPDAVAANGSFSWVRTASFLENPNFYPPRLTG